MDWTTEALKKVDDLVEGGMDHNDAILETIDTYAREIRIAAEIKLNNKFLETQKKRWAEPPDDDMNQLRFSLDGHEFAISDARVRKVLPDGDITFIPAWKSTGEERLASLAARIHHHRNWVTRSEAEHTREHQQINRAFEVGLDLMNSEWGKVRHRDTKCWRCGGGWVDGDPFERGHSDRPRSQGGTEVEWEHRSCNRSAQDNPVARPET
jgi:hypothetical protein